MQDSINNIRQEVLSCAKCIELVNYRNKIVFSTGSGSNGIMLIGIAPSYVGGNITGKPMSDGKSKTGYLVQKILDRNGLISEECYNTNILFCSTPYNREPTPREIANCLPYTERELTILKPKLVILLGRVPSICLLGTSCKRDRLIDIDNIIYFPTYHPSYILKQNSSSLEVQYIDRLSEVINAIPRF